VKFRPLALAGALLRRRPHVAIVAVAVLAQATSTRTADAAVTSVGNVFPVAPSSGTYTGPVYVGDLTMGHLQLTLGSSLNVTNGMFLGNAAGASGLLELSGVNTLITVAGASTNLEVGSAGSGQVSMVLGARLNVVNDLRIAVQNTSTGTVSLDGFGTTLDVTDDVTIGVAGQSALLQLTSGSKLFADSVVLGSSVGSIGRGTAAGAGTSWQQDSAMTIGDNGDGEFQVHTGASARTAAVTLGVGANGIGVAVASGAGTNWQIAGAVTVASAGLGTFEVRDGANASSTGVTRLAVLDGSEAHVIASGVNAVWTAGSSMIVGEMGYATLDVRGGARVTTGNVQIGDNLDSRGEVIVEGRGSLLKINGTLDVSDPGEGDLTIANSGLVTTTGVTRVAAAGRLSFVGGRLEVGGASGLTNNGLVQGSGRILGAVTNSATGKVRTRLGDVLNLSTTLTTAGLVELDGGELETGGALINTGDIDAQAAIIRAGGAGLTNNAGAQLAVIGGTVDIFGPVVNNASAQIVVGGKSTLVFHDTITNNGLFHVFEGSDVVALENLSFMPTSAVSVQLGLSDDEEEFVPIESAGQAALAGSLSVALASGYAPQLGDTFQVVTASNVSGTFSTASLPTLNAGLAWDLDYAPQSVTLTVVPGLTADFNGDGQVNSTDLASWRTGFGKTTGAVRGDGDADGDGDVDGNDFLAWQRQLGQGSAAPATAPVPEPGTAALCAMGLAAIAGHRRRRGQTA
jgi:T5SS/PEP-CTERM-associated repeat protein